MGYKLYNCKIVNRYYKYPSKFESAQSRIKLKQAFKALMEFVDTYKAENILKFKD